MFAKIRTEVLAVVTFIERSGYGNIVVVFRTVTTRMYYFYNLMKKIF